ncbi:MAG: hypothetical protein JXM73_26275, partial [Anaerolineae bacterium]|nr:hypothetical protein [Anaerolineae bacterium]
RHQEQAVEMRMGSGLLTQGPHWINAVALLAGIDQTKHCSQAPDFHINAFMIQRCGRSPGQEQPGVQRRRPLPLAAAIELEQIIQNRVAAGLACPPSRAVPPDPVSEQERRALADKLGRAPGKPLSQIIIEERGA